MAEKSFGVKELHVTGTGTPTVQTTGNLNLTASGTVAVSNNLTIGGQVTSNAYVTGRIGLGKDPSSTTYPLEVSFTVFASEPADPVCPVRDFDILYV